MRNSIDRADLMNRLSPFKNLIAMIEAGFADASIPFAPFIATEKDRCKEILVELTKPPKDGPVTKAEYDEANRTIKLYNSEKFDRELAKLRVCNDGGEHDLYDSSYFESDGNHEEWFNEQKTCRKCGIKIKEPYVKHFM